MSVHTSFQTSHRKDLVSSILQSEPPLSSNKSSMPDMYANNTTLNSSRHHQRPVSEILKSENVTSPETQVLDKWFEDLQQYESSLESMASANVDPTYKEEVQHVDQWFRYLNEAERTATIYTLLQHSTQVQIRFFSAVLQQMSQTDPLGALLSPAHPEKGDMQTQLAGAMVKAEFEANQKLLSVLPYQTGNVVSRPGRNHRNHIDRHSFALGDTEEHNHLFSSSGNDFLHPSRVQPRVQKSVIERPKSVVESDLSSIFNHDWSYPGGLVNSSIGSRPKSADISNWSFGTSVNHDKKDPWSANTFTGTTEDHTADPIPRMTPSWQLNNTSPILNSDTKGFRRNNRGVNGNIPGTVPESDEHSSQSIQSPPPAPPTNIVLSMYEDKSTPHIVFKDSYESTRCTSPAPKPNAIKSPSQQYGHFLSPKLEENGYISDHSESSNRSSLGSRKPKQKQTDNLKERKYIGDVDMQLLEDVPAWLRSLRLHKYNSIFESMKWQDMLKMDDETLLGKGVAALGARRKLLKVFDQIKAHCDENRILY